MKETALEEQMLMLCLEGMTGNSLSTIARASGHWDCFIQRQEDSHTIQLSGRKVQGTMSLTSDTERATMVTVF